MSGFVFSEKPIDIDHGEGPYLYSEDGTEYLDFGASYAVAPLGHSHPEVTAAIQQQAETLTYVQASYPVDVRTELYERLADLAPGDLSKVWLCNSGTEANEAAMKFARSATGNSKIVATKRAGDDLETEIQIPLRAAGWRHRVRYLRRRGGVG